jgi:enamine deaminase RidA (YjgF/YER057c/UK114 family)
MGVQQLTPEGLFKPKGYTQVIVATGRRMVFVSGQVSMDADGQLVAPGDVAGQARQVYANLRAALVDAGPTTWPASTLVGVQALAEPGYLVEVEAIAITDPA